MDFAKLLKIDGRGGKVMGLHGKYRKRKGW
jgi:hypothetical protein